VLDLKRYSPEVRVQLQELLSLKGEKSPMDVEKRRRLRKQLRDQGFLSLPFSMNLKRPA
jgi:hypothetical protein